MSPSPDPQAGSPAERAVAALSEVFAAIFREAAIRALGVPVGQAEPPGGGQAEVPVLPVQTALDREILAALEQATRPLKQEALARRTGRHAHGHFRERIKTLKQSGLIVELPGGLWLACRPRPE